MRSCICTQFDVCDRTWAQAIIIKIVSSFFDGLFCCYRLFIIIGGITRLFHKFQFQFHWQTYKPAFSGHQRQLFLFVFCPICTTPSAESLQSHESIHLVHTPSRNVSTLSWIPEQVSCLTSFGNPAQTNAATSLADKCLYFRTAEGPLKQKFISVQSANGINLLPLPRPVISRP